MSEEAPHIHRIDSNDIAGDVCIDCGIWLHGDVSGAIDVAADNKQEPRRGCEKCDSCGGRETYANQVKMPICGRVRYIDWCIHDMVAALNAAGIETVASCCGHGVQDGSILLEDGGELIIKNRGAKQ